jgi:hypothetical protein
MRIFLLLTGPSRTPELLVSVHPNIFYNGKTQHRNFISFNKIRQMYQNYWKPPPPKPPYLHICQIGDPVLRGKAAPVEPHTIKSPEIQKVRKNIHTLFLELKNSDFN